MDSDDTIKPDPRETIIGNSEPTTTISVRVPLKMKAAFRALAKELETTESTLGHDLISWALEHRCLPDGNAPLPPPHVGIQPAEMKALLAELAVLLLSTQQRRGESLDTATAVALVNEVYLSGDIAKFMAEEKAVQP
jgi:hypothetical protein